MPQEEGRNFLFYVAAVNKPHTCCECGIQLYRSHRIGAETFGGRFALGRVSPRAPSRDWPAAATANVSGVAPPVLLHATKRDTTSSLDLEHALLLQQARRGERKRNERQRHGRVLLYARP